MAEKKAGIASLLAELRRRKVVRVAVTYGIVGLAVIAVAGVIAETIVLPPQFMDIVIVAVLLGLPIAVVLAWAYQVAPDDAVATQASDTRGRTSAARLLVAAALLVIVAVGAYEYRGSSSLRLTPVGVQYLDSMAVMPLENLTGDPAMDHLGIGITEEIITHLARIPPLKVISRYSVQAVAARKLTFPELGGALGVRHIIDGSIRLDGDDVHIRLQHINAESDTRVWDEDLVAPRDELLDMQENIASVVTAKVVEVIPGLTAPSVRAHVDLGPGQEAYLLGKRSLGQRTAEGFVEAIAYFLESIELDPTFAPAHADLASAYALSISYRYDVGIDAYTLAAQSLALADHAIALAPNLAAGYASRGYLGALVNQPAGEVATDFERAATLQPNAASIPSWRARSLAQLGRYDEALSEAARAVDLDPLAPGRHIALAELSLQLGRYEEAIASAKTAIALEPGLIRARAVQARAMLLGGRPESCANLLLGPHRVLRATCLRASGRTEEADRIIARVLTDIRDKDQDGDSYTAVIAYEDLAVDFALQGNAERALFWVARSYAASPSGVDIRVLESPLFDRVREDPGFSGAIEAIRSDLYDRVRRDAELYR